MALPTCWRLVRLIQNSSRGKSGFRERRKMIKFFVVNFSQGETTLKSPGTGSWNVSNNAASAKLHAFKIYCKPKTNWQMSSLEKTPSVSLHHTWLTIWACTTVVVARSAESTCHGTFERKKYSHIGFAHVGHSRKVTVLHFVLAISI